MKQHLVLTLLLAVPTAARADSISTFEGLGLPAHSVNNDAGPSGYFTSGGNAFNNFYSADYGGYWTGWTLSNTTDTTTPGAANNSAIAGSGANGSPTYAVASTFCGANVNPFHPDGSIVNLAADPISIQVTNTTFGYYSMLNGDSYARQFGPGDFFLLTIAGYDAPGTTDTAAGNAVGEVDFYLADFRGKNPYIVTDWQTVDLTSLAGAKSLRFGLLSSDNDPVYGLNTPASFAVDNLAVTPEPAAWLLLAIGAAGCGVARLRKRAHRRSAAPLS
jgi:hypothetical protein